MRTLHEHALHGYTPVSLIFQKSVFYLVKSKDYGHYSIVVDITCNRDLTFHGSLTRFLTGTLPWPYVRSDDDDVLDANVPT